ncbi:Rossmann fold nucleotide-binding protein [Nocardioides mangrovicus]|uniref:Rossmann fold nucleotide-binding protein n=1 Tax=Nocardioides mangrovicus TaxID=2478913 RepID=A0A3L8P159_9ACTN|nr:LOG family protein [Nocardioides mangrovicus]RLV48864.1 Rossmann fold nucleotide-binding protein [Nocardioides mangrovicus]
MATAAAHDLPFDPERTTLYSPAELYAGLGGGYPATPDARVYAWDQGDRARERTLAAALHDHGIDDALEAYVAGRRIAGVMGAHAVPRGSTDYATAARLGHALGAAFTVATGGGPGAMEAANLGAYVPDHLDDALAELAACPGYDDVTAWARSGLAVVERVEGRENLGVPTWFYGHEPPNVFATSIAKYFHNAVREDVLLRICNAGIVFLPGSAGTVQEVFQDACENYYAAADDVAPMVLLGVEHWTQRLPVAPLLQALARESRMIVHVTDDVDEAVALLGA